SLGQRLFQRRPEPVPAGLAWKITAHAGAPPRGGGRSGGTEVFDHPSRDITLPEVRLLGHAILLSPVPPVRGTRLSPRSPRRRPGGSCRRRGRARRGGPDRSDRRPGPAGRAG